MYGRARVVPIAAGGLVLVVAALLAPGVALAHPLGNFTINHYAGLRVAPDTISLDVVVDMAEVPTFEVRQEIDANGDGDVSDAEAAAARTPRCRSLAPSLSLTVAGAGTDLDLVGAGVDFPTGAGGLPTLRLVCEFRAALATRIGPDTPVSFADRSFGDRIGWREITVAGDGVAVAGPGIRAASVSDRLTHYPADLLQHPLADAAAAFTASPGGAALPAWVAPDAAPVGGTSPTAPAVAPPASPSAPSPGIADARVSPVRSAASVPGGIGDEIDGLLRTPDVTPIVLLGSILAAVALGAGHAITPGHGKTLMGAYLVGRRGEAAHALGLGLAVAVSHTLGIVALALVVLGASALLPPERFERLATVGSALALTGVGGWLVVGELRRRRAGARPRTGHDRHPHDHRHDHPHTPPEARITWRSLALLGFAGGLVPSTNALLILLAAIATHRPGFGLLLVVAFGLGMAAIMTGVGLSLVQGRDWLAAHRPSGLDRLATLAPAGAAVFVLALGLVLTSEAVGAVRL